MSAGCASIPVTPLSSDTFLISKQSAAGMFVSMPALKAKVIQEANAFADSKGKVAIPINLREVPPAPGRMPYVEYQFRLVDRNSPEAQGRSLQPRADVVIERTEKIEASVRTKDESEKRPDLYAELIKLDDLRKKGLITDAEYETQKQKLLSGK